SSKCGSGRCATYASRDREPAARTSTTPDADSIAVIHARRGCDSDAQADAGSGSDSMLERAAVGGRTEGTDPARIREVGSGRKRLIGIGQTTENAFEKGADDAGNGKDPFDATALRNCDEVQLGFRDGAFRLATISEPARSGGGAGVNADAVSEGRPHAWLGGQPCPQPGSAGGGHRGGGVFV